MKRMNFSEDLDGLDG